MADPLQMVLANFAGGGTPVFMGLLVFFIMIMGGVGTWLLYDYMKWRPRKYKAIIFETVGNSLSPFFSEVWYKRKAKNKGYYLKGSKEILAHITLSQAFPGKKGPVFVLRKIMCDNKEVLMPMSVKEYVDVLEEEGKDLREVNIEEFVSIAKLDDLDVASVETIKHDNNKFKWNNTMQQILMFMAPLIMIVLAFILTGWAAKNNLEATADISTISGEFTTQTNAMVTIAENIEALVMHVGAANTPPPG